jgi:hypothetical protein
MIDHSHLVTLFAALAYALVCSGVDRTLTRSDEREATPQRPYRFIPPWPPMVASAVVVLLSPDALHGATFAICLSTLYVAAWRDACHRIVFAEFMFLGLSAELLIRALDGTAYEAAIGAGALGILATLLIIGLDALDVPQGFGDILPAIVIGATFPPTILLFGIAVGFGAYAAITILTRKLISADRTVPAVPAFALAAVIATALATIHPT